MTRNRRIAYLFLITLLLFVLVELFCAAAVKVQAAAARSSDQCNLKQLGVALHNYASASKDLLPEASIPLKDVAPGERLSWVVALLPHIEQDSVYKQFDLTKGWNAEPNLKASQKHLRTFRCPSARSGGLGLACSAMPSLPQSGFITHYVAISGVGSDSPTLPLKDRRCGLFGHNRLVHLDHSVTDGTSNVLALIEASQADGSWSAAHTPTLRWIDPEREQHFGVDAVFGRAHTSPWYWRAHKGNYSCSGLRLDGSVVTFNSDTSLQVLSALATINGGEVAGDF